MAEGLLFAAGVAVSLAASWLLVSRLERLGERAGFSEAWLGLVAALAADAPEITSAVTALARGQASVGAGVVIGSNVFNLAALLGLAAVVAGRIAFHRRVVLLGGVPAVWVAAVTLLTVTVLAPVAGLALTAAVLGPYVAVLGMRRSRLEGLRLPARWTRWLVAAIHEEEDELAEAVRPRRGTWRDAIRRGRGAGRRGRGEHGHGGGGHRGRAPVRGRGHRHRRAGAGDSDQLAERGGRGVPGPAGPRRRGAEHRAEQQRDQHRGGAAHPGVRGRARAALRPGHAGGRVVRGPDRARARARLPGPRPGPWRAAIIAGTWRS